LWINAGRFSAVPSLEGSASNDDDLIESRLMFGFRRQVVGPRRGTEPMVSADVAGWGGLSE